MSYEPPLDDDIALGKDDGLCEDCGYLLSDDTCGEPDVMYEEALER